MTQSGRIFITCNGSGHYACTMPHDLSRGSTKNDRHFWNHLPQFVFTFSLTGRYDI